MSIQKSSDKEDITMTISYVDKTNLPDENPYKLVMTLGEYITLRELAAVSKKSNYISSHCHSY